MRCRTKARRLRSNVHPKPLRRWAKLIRSGDGAYSLFLFVLLSTTSRTLWKCHPYGNPPTTAASHRGLERFASHIPTATLIIYSLQYPISQIQGRHHYRGRCIAHGTPSSIGRWRSRCCPTHSPPTLTVDVAVRIFIVASPSKVVRAVRTRCGQIRHALMIHGSHLTERERRPNETSVGTASPILGFPQGVARRPRGRRKTIARIIREAANVNRKTNASVWYKGCTDRPLATTEARA